MIYVLIGTRAQLIKMAPVMIELKKRGVPYTYVSTAQHADTMDELHEDFGIRAPDFYLAELNERKTVFGLVYWFFKILLTSLFSRPKWLSSKGIGLIHGDTLSTLLGAILLKLTGNTVGHVESGLRSHNLWNPFPEEILRILTFSLTEIYFCPDSNAINNVKNYSGLKFNTHGNSLIDSVRLATTHRTSDRLTEIPYCIFSFHRYENLTSASRTRFILEAIQRSAQGLKTLVILHPLTARVLNAKGLLKQLSRTNNIHMVNRMRFFDFINAVANAEYIVTDGGSNQEECSYLGVPCAVLRSHTERSEGMNSNSVLISFEWNKFCDFVSNASSLRTGSNLTACSPATTIVERLQNVSNSSV